MLLPSVRVAAYTHSVLWYTNPAQLPNDRPVGVHFQRHRTVHPEVGPARHARPSIRTAMEPQWEDSSHT